MTAREEEQRKENTMSYVIVIELERCEQIMLNELVKKTAIIINEKCRITSKNCWKKMNKPHLMKHRKFQFFLFRSPGTRQSQKKPLKSLFPLSTEI